MAAEVIVSTGDLGTTKYEVIGAIIVGATERKYDLDVTKSAYGALQKAAQAVGGDAVVFARFLLRPAVAKGCLGGTEHATVVVAYGTAVRRRMG